jgi:hypothetical protein
MGFAGFARSTALDGAQSEPEWMVHAAISPCMWYASRILLLFVLFLMFYLFL